MQEKVYDMYVKERDEMRKTSFHMQTEIGKSVLNKLFKFSTQFK